MNILFLVDGFWPRIGGTETACLQLIQELQARGHSCKVLAQRDRPSWPKEEIYNSISIHRFDFNAIIANRDLSILASIQNSLGTPDIVHLNGFERANAFIFVLFAKMLRAPKIITAHAPYLQGKSDLVKMTPIIEKATAYADQIGCVSQWVFDELEKTLPAIKPKLKLIYNGLPLPQDAPSPLPFSPPTLLLFGRLSWEKGFSTAIDAFALLKQDAKLIIAGDGPERPRLEKQVDELNLRASVQFTGVLAQEEVPATINRATLVIVPSILESFGLVILQSMQMGRPVIASSLQGIPEVVAHGKTGLLVPKQDPVALCQAIRELLGDPEKARQMGIEGRKRAMLFTSKQNTDQYEDLYVSQRNHCRL